MQKILNPAIRLPQRMMERCKSHNRIEQGVGFESNLEERCVKEATCIVFEEVMMMRQIILMVVKKELEISW